MSRAIPLVVLVSLAMLVTLASAKPLREAPRKTAISRQNATSAVKLKEIPRDVWEIVWLPKVRQLALLTWERPAEVVDTESFETLRVIGAGRQLVHVAVSPDNNKVAWCEKSTRVEIHDLRSGPPQFEPAPKVPGTKKNIVIDTQQSQPKMEFSPDGKFLATGGYGTTAKVWNVVTGELVHALDTPGEGGLTVAYSPDGKLLAVGNRNSVSRIFDAATGKVLHTLAKNMSHELQFSPDGNLLAIVYVDGSVAIWNAATGKLLRSRNTGAQELYTLDWSPAGDVLATAGREGRITLWDPHSLDVLKVFDAPEWVIRVRFSPDGSRLLTAGGTAVQSPERKLVVWGLAR